MAAYGNKVGVRTINKLVCDIYANESGTFTIIRDGTFLGAGDTLDIAVSNARTKIKKGQTKVHVEFIDRSSGEKGFATGIHAGHGAILVEIGGAKDQMRSHDTPFKPNTPKTVITTYFANKAAIDKAQQANRAIDREWTQQIGPRVEQAIIAAQEEEAKASPPFRIRRKPNN